MRAFARFLRLKLYILTLITSIHCTKDPEDVNPIDPSIHNTTVSTNTPALKSLLLVSEFNTPSALDSWTKQEKILSSSIFLMQYAIPVEISHSARFELNKPDKNNSSEQFKARLIYEPGNKMTSEGWFGMRTYMPQSVSNDPNADVIAEWNTLNADEYNNLLMSLQIHNAKWVFELPKINSTQVSEDIEAVTRIPLADFKKGVWVNWVFHIKFSDSYEGLIEVWKDNELVYTYKGANTYHIKTDVAFKIGLSKPALNNAEVFRSSPNYQRIIYFDDIRIGNENSSFKSVNPGDNL